jgi:hypothetical protein
VALAVIHCHIDSDFSNSTCQGDSCNAAQYLTVHFHYRTSYCFFFFQNIKLNETSTKAEHCSKDANGKQHLGEDSAELYSCQRCKNSLSHRDILSRRTGASSRETTSCCEMCVKLLSDNRNPVQRLRSRERPFSCNMCIKGFTSRSNVDNHIRVHTGEQPYSRKVCNKSFAQRFNPKAHLTLHSGERPFSCEICKK